MKKILIIEDNKDLQEIYRHSFEKDGYEVITKNDGAEGFEAVTQELPDVILLDLMMPGTNGFEFLQKVKEIGALTVPVIVFSNISDVDIINKAVQEGASAVLLKVDFVGKQLVDKINSVVAEFEEKKKSVQH